MTHSDFNIRTARSSDDRVRLETLFDAVFLPEEVGKLASTLFEHHPDTQPSYWFMAEHVETGELAAAFTLIPWRWSWFGESIKVAEQGIVATLPKFQGLGLQSQLNAAFDKTLKEQSFDLAIIQGIPGFYQKFGYHYSLPIDNHINLEWHQIPQATNPVLTFREATVGDIPFLQEQERINVQVFHSTNTRSSEAWRYLLTHSRETDYGSDFWIAQSQGQPLYYCRRNYFGFGEGLILSEVSEQLCYSHAIELLNFLKQQNAALQKPYLRLNLSNDASLSRIAMQLGAPEGKPYGFQVKIPDHQRWLAKQSKLFSARLAHSSLKAFSGVFRLNFYKFAVDIVFEQGGCIDVLTSDQATPATEDANIPLDLAPALLLGRHTWRELNATRPDLFGNSATSRLLLDVLFPAVSSWHPLPY